MAHVTEVGCVDMYSCSDLAVISDSALANQVKLDKI